MCWCSFARHILIQEQNYFKELDLRKKNFTSNLIYFFSMGNCIFIAKINYKIYIFEILFCEKKNKKIW